MRGLLMDRKSGTPLLLMGPRVKKALGLPPGSIRALLTLMTVGFM
jgi:hypothetical protein